MALKFTQMCSVMTFELSLFIVVFPPEQKYNDGTKLPSADCRL